MYNHLVPQNRLFHTLSLIKKRRQRMAQRSRSVGGWIQLAAAISLALTSLSLASLALAAPAALAYLAHDLPDVAALSALLDPKEGALLQPSQLYDREGRPLMTLAPPGYETRTVFQAADNRTLAAVALAALDPAFYGHPGFSLSPTPQTLAERLAAGLLLPGEGDSWLKRVRTGLLAAQASQQFGREQVLDWSLNSLHFGRMVVGVGDAARYYLGKPAEQLSLAESALLIATAQNPDFNPFDFPQIALSNQKALLRNLRAQDLITQEQLQEAISENISLASDPGPPACPAPDFCAFALEQLYDKLGQVRVEAGGLAVITTLDLDLMEKISSGLGDQGAEVLLLDPGSGELLAMLGDALLEQPIPGALLSPFIYLSAFAEGQAPASLIWDAPASLLPSVPPYENADGRFHGPINLRTALANHYLVPTVQLLSQVGPPSAWTIAQQAGLRSLLWEEGPSAYSPLLDGSRSNLAELAQAYGTLANLGTLAGQLREGELSASSLLIVRGPLGEILLDASSPQTRAITGPELAYLVNDALSDDSARQSASGALELSPLGRPAAVSGHTASGWLVGFSPQRVLVMHAAQPEDTGALFQLAFEAAHLDLPISSWAAPPGIVTQIVCVPSGQLPTADCPQTRREPFLAGRQPNQPDGLYQRFALNQLNGQLATIFTPPEWIEERVLLNLPDEVREWARAAGLPVPPTTYDELPGPGQTNELTIRSPAPFSTVSGMVPIEAALPTEGVTQYRILVGPGLYPRAWEEIHRGTSLPARGPLATWDTAGLSGEYAIQLQVFYADQRVETHYTLVTIDN